MTRRFTRRRWLLAAGGILLSAGLAALPSRSGARAAVEQAVQRMGGPDRLRAIATLSLESVGYTNLLEQSERPEGPWIPQIEHLTETWDTTRGRWKSSAKAEIADSVYTIETVVDGPVAARRFGDRWMPGGPAQIAQARLWMALSPHRALLAALDAPDLASEPPRVFQGVPHRVVSYDWDGARVRLLLNAQSGFLTAAETTRPFPDDLYWQVWGDVTTRVAYSFWDLRPGGLFYPLQWDVQRGGRPWRALMISKLEIHPTLPDDAFAIPEEERRAFATGNARPLDDPQLGNPARPASEIAPGVVHIPGAWAVTLVRQPEGVVILEAPVSAAYSARVIEEAGRRFPGAPIRAVVSTDDAWPHIGGIREYAARGIPIYLLDLNVPQIRRALASPHRMHPDALARRPRAGILRPVPGKTVIGSGDNAVELYPVRGETGERAMIAYLRGARVLYASDLIQIGRDGPPEYAWEVAQVVERQNLKVDTVFAMHTEPTPWTRILQILEKARSAGR